jgi:hypothetical protein
MQQKKASVDTLIYALASELHCLPDLIGREYEIIYADGKPIKILQKPIPFNKFMALLGQMRLKNDTIDKQMKKRGRHG